MSKKLSVVLIILGILLIAYNVTLINFDNPMEGNSVIALIGIAAALCAIVLLLIYLSSKKVQKKMNEK